VTQVRACGIADVPDGAMKPVEIGSHALLIARIGGKCFAVSDVCTHARARLSDGYLNESECTVECSLHNAVFSLETGEALEFPAEEPLSTYPVTVVGDDILVELPDE